MSFEFSDELGSVESSPFCGVGLAALLVLLERWSPRFIRINSVATFP
jgi:hypothetical protein